MSAEGRFLVDVGMDGVAFPIRVASKVDPAGQSTVATISVTARIVREFEAEWIDGFIRILHRHGSRIGTDTLKSNIMDYYTELKATAVTVAFACPVFVERLTPVSREKCLVKHRCTYAARATSKAVEPRITLRTEVPVITTYPGSSPESPGGLFGQLTTATVEVASNKEVFPEDIVDMVNRHALAPVYSFLTKDDQAHLIEKVHTERKSSVVMTDEIKDELARNRDIAWYSVACRNSGMLHSYSTILSTEKSMWVPWSDYDVDEP